MTEKIYKFYGKGCGPCVVMGNSLNALIKKYSNIEVIEVDVNDPNNKFLVDKFEVVSIPTIVKDGAFPIVVTGMVPPLTLEEKLFPSDL